MIHLNRRHILVTRPKESGEKLCLRIRELGGTATHLPTLAFEAINDNQQIHDVMSTLDTKQWLIFVSPEAVRVGIPIIRQQWPVLPHSLHIAAIGGGTAASLKAAGYPVHACPLQEWTSEGLLAMPVFQDVKGVAVTIVRGEGGREWLASTLQARGAKVDHFIIYRRVLPRVTIEPYLDLFRAHPLDAIVCGSFEGVNNLKLMVGSSGWPLIEKVPLIVLSERIKKLAHGLGFQTIWVAPNAESNSILAVIKDIDQ